VALHLYCQCRAAHSYCPWYDADVNSVGVAGSATDNNGVFTINGTGYDMWGSYDYFNFLQQAVTGDFTITGRLVSPSSPSGGGKAGLIARQEDEDDSPYVNIQQQPTGIGLQDLTSFAGGTNYLGGISGLTPPYWQRLTRTGNLFSAYVTPDGVNWTALNSATVTMPTNLVTGIAVTAQDENALATVVVDNVAINQPPLVTATTLIPNGTHVVHTVASGLPLEDPGASLTDGQIMDEGMLTAGANQHWTVTNLGSNIVTLVNAVSGLNSDVAGASTSTGVRVDQAPATGATNQQWQVTETVYKGKIRDWEKRLGDHPKAAIDDQVKSGHREKA